MKEELIAYPSAAICGLYCENCPAFGQECYGCLSSYVAEECRRCPNGFRLCVQEHGVTRCFECPEFPCARLEDFTQTHIVNGIKHHELVIENLREMRDKGIEQWLRRMDHETRCPTCERRLMWFETSCPLCDEDKR